VTAEAGAQWLLVGGHGMLGRDVRTALHDRRVAVPSPDELDIRDTGACDAWVRGRDVVVNCAAWTAVDAAESDEAAAFDVNARGAANLARACARAGAWLVHVSTDYVFAGDGTRPYREDDPPAPRSAYGRTKAAGEWAVQALLPGRHHLVRTAWLYGGHGPSFVHTMMRLARQDERPVEVVDDQHGQPTWSRDVADRIVALVTSTAPAGTYHATSRGEATWYELAREVFSHVGADPERVRPVGTDAVPRPAPRPRWSVLGHGAWAAAGLDPIGDWAGRLDTFFG
jgi:dTDP-4-dehydrorhamnose reductase